MALMTKNQDRTYTSEALDVLDCFTHGFDEVLCQIAEQYADERKDRGPIDVQDIQSAAAIIVEAVAKSDIDPSVKSLVSGMLNCLASKTSHR